MSIDIIEIQVETCYSESSVWEFNKFNWHFLSFKFIHQLNWLSFANLKINEDISTKNFQSVNIYHQLLNAFLLFFLMKQIGT